MGQYKSSLAKSQAVSQVLPILATPTSPGPSPLAALDQPFRSFEFQPWVTIRANASGPSPWPPVLSVTQEDSGWIDLSRFADAAFWVDVAEVTQPSGGTVLLNIESSPSLDETCFKPVCQPIAISPITDPTSGGVVPLLVRTARTPTTVPLSKWTRWRLSVSGASSGPWDATFRIRGAGGHSSFVVPPQLSGCILWLRGDLGVTQLPAPYGTVSVWADQSGRGNDAFQTTQTFQPFYAQPGINGQKVVTFDPNNTKHMKLTSSLGSPSALHIFLVHRRPTATATLFAYCGLWLLGTPGTSAFASHMPWLDGHIYDDGGGAVRYDTGAPVPPIVPLNVSQVYEVQNQSGSWKSLINGLPHFTSPTNTVGAGVASPELGSNVSVGVYYYGDWAELIIYDRILSPNERAIIINYLSGRYGPGAV